MKRTVWILVVVVMVALLATPLVYAKKVRAIAGASIVTEVDLLGLACELRHLRDELQLTADQQGELRAIATHTRAENEIYRNELKSSVGRAGALLLADPGNVLVAESLLMENEDARNGIRRHVLEGIAEALSVLTPEQRQILAAHMRENLGNR